MTHVALKTIAAIVAISYLLLPRQANTDTKEDANFSVSIAVPLNSDGVRKINVRDEGSHFHVVVTNESDKETRLWEPWNSWGCQNLQFEVLDDAGNHIHSITYAQTWFTRNSPSCITLAPGDHHVFEINFRGAWRDSFLAAAMMGSQSCLHLRAVYQISPTKESDQHRVWTGRVQSSVNKYAFEFQHMSPSEWRRSVFKNELQVGE